MAGLGRKDFQAGAVLSAADVDGYLMDQSVMKFANTAAAGSAYGTAIAEGMTFYLSDTDEQVFYNGASFAKQGGTGAAGVNKIINGDFAINQRAFSSTSTFQIFMYDRFKTSSGGTTGTSTWTAQTFTPGTAPVAGYEAKNYIRLVTSGYSNADSFSGIFNTTVEDVRTFAGQTVTVSFWAKAGSGTPNIGVRCVQYFGSGGSPSASVQYTSTVAVTTSWARYSQTFNISSIAGKTIGTSGDSYFQVGLVASAGSSTYSGAFGSMLQNNTFEVWGIQAEAGSAPTPFSLASGTLQGELAACQRYYYRITSGGAGSRFANLACDSTTVTEAVIPFPVTMRIAPTALEQSGTASDYSVRTAGATITASAVPTWLAANTFNGSVNLAVASGLVAGAAGTLRPANSNAYLAWSAEL